ncbi:hypothetical protein ACFL1X_00585 [Candidatus Hydrogenedentota bacterium]
MNTIDDNEVRNPKTITGERVVIFLVLVGCILLLAWQVSRGTRKAQSASISLSKEIIDFGDVSTEFRQIETIGVINRGHGELLIEGIDSSTPLLEASFKGTVLYPSERGDLTIILKAADMVAIDSGEIGRVAIKSNDSDRPIVKVKVYASKKEKAPKDENTTETPEDK